MADYPDNALELGTPAPDFELHSTPDQKVDPEDLVEAIRAEL
jgi:peroxiredoxin